VQQRAAPDRYKAADNKQHECEVEDENYVCCDL
jgi:hypothetical protein